MTSRRRMTALALAATLPLTACMQDNPLDEEGPNVDEGAVGPNAAVDENVELLQVQLAYPDDGLYEEGEDAELLFGIANSGTEPATLVDITGDDFAEATTVDGGDIDIEVEAGTNTHVGREEGPAVVLVGLEQELRSSESIPVTFVFEEAGEVTVDAMVTAN
jgi:hypothetical protein